MKKKRLSQIVSVNTLTAILAVFLGMVAVTFIFVSIYAEIKSESYVRSSLESINDIVANRMEYNLKNQTKDMAVSLGELIAEDPSYPGSEEMKDEMSAEHNINTEADVVSPEGIIISSSAEENLGFDMASGEQSSELLCLLDGKTEVFLQGMMPRTIDGTLMKYCGAYIPEYGGIVLFGFNPEDYDIFKELSLTAQVKNSKVGRNGYYLYLDESLLIMSSQDNAHMNETFSLGHDVNELSKSGQVVKEEVYGVKSYVGVMQDDKEYIVAVYPVSEAWEAWNVTMIFLFVIYAVIFALLFILIRLEIHRHVVDGVNSLNRTLTGITEGDLNIKADFRETLEFDGLSDGINHTVDRLKELIKEAEGRIDAELALASKIQLSFLPHDFPAFPDRKEFELFASMVPAKEVGGDFYDFFLTDDDHLALVMADVSGKGLPAAMFMVMAKDKIRHSVMKHGTDVAGAVSEINLELIKENDAGLFVTVWLGIFNLTNGHMDYVDAGHEYPAVCSGDGRFRVEEDVHCPPVAARKKTKYEAGSFDLHPGDILYLYTDGVTEANDPDGEMFRRSRMLDALNRAGNVSVRDIDAAVRKAVSDFVKDAPQFDDTTFLVFRYRGKETGGAE